MKQEVTKPWTNFTEHLKPVRLQFLQHQWQNTKCKLSTRQQTNAFADKPYRKASPFNSFSHTEHHLSAQTNNPRNWRVRVLHQNYHWMHCITIRTCHNFVMTNQVTATMDYVTVTKGKNTSQQPKEQPPCVFTNCGGRFPHNGGMRSCPAQGPKCHWCHKLNHFTKHVRSEVTQPEANQSDTDNECTFTINDATKHPEDHCYHQQCTS